jgi:hypothetical protein
MPQLMMKGIALFYWKKFWTVGMLTMLCTLIRHGLNQAMGIAAE